VKTVSVKPSPGALTRRAFGALVLGSACDRALPPIVRPSASAIRPADPPASPRATVCAGLPRAPLGSYPTPVERSSTLGARLGIASLWIKRDDHSALPYGGGKVRKLEFFLGDALRLGKTSVATFGGVGSNHALATALYARRSGLGAVLFLVPEPRSDEVRRHLLIEAAAGADLRLGSVRSEEDPGLGAALAALPDRGEGTYVIPRGGSSPLGNVGFFAAAFELAEQVERGDMPHPDVVYVPMGTMGTVVGLALGVVAAGLRTRVAAVRASNPGTSSRQRLDAMLEETADFLRRCDTRPDVAEARARIRIVADQLGDGYGRPTRSGEEAIAIAHDDAGLSLEPTYTAKALAALVADAPALRDQTVLFWNTHNGHPLPPPAAVPADLPEGLRPYV